MTAVIPDLPKELVKKKRLPYLEGIRGLAAFIVVIHHYLLAFYPAFASGNADEKHFDSLELWYYKSPFIFLTNGQLAVFVFFVLSGYVLSKKFFVEKDMSYLASAFIRRLPRLHLPMAFSIIIAFILLKLSLNFNVEAGMLTKSRWLASLDGDPSVITFIKTVIYKALFFGDSSYNTVLWSISVEFYGSLFVFSILALMYKSRNSLFILAFIFFLLFMHAGFEYCAFVLGIVLNYSNGFKFGRIVYKRITVVFLIVLGVLLGGFPHVYFLSTPTIKGTFFEFLDYSFIINRSAFINCIGAYFLILAAQQSLKLQRVFSGKLLNFFGAISFSVYLVHTLILQSFSSYLFLKLQNQFSYNLSVFFVFVLSFTLIVLISYVMTLYVDNKSVVASQFIYDRYFIEKEKPKYTGSDEKVE